MRGIIAITAIMCACGSTDHGAATADGGPDGSGSGSGSGSGDAPSSTGRATIFTIVLENKNDESVLGSPNAPYLNSLLPMGALATNYKDVAHPSLPNYLHMISGANQYPGFVDVEPTQIPFFPVDAPSLATQLEAAHIP